MEFYPVPGGIFDRRYGMNGNVRGTNPRVLIGEGPAIPRTIDLYGRAMDGHPVLWKRDVQVVPLTEFELEGRWIKSGHYVINHNGTAVVVHCGNRQNTSVSVQFMSAGLAPCSLPRSLVESMLLGKMVVSEEQQAAVFEGARLSDLFQ
jgi:hypothetical protein